MKHKHFIFSSVLIAVTIAVAVVFFPLHNNKPSYLLDIPKGGDFVLTSKNGAFDLKQQRGKIVLIYFGYTFCPDICPTNLALMAQALNELSEKEMAQVTPVFISVDPERDSLDHLENYATYFHHNIVGMTGSEAIIADIAKQYGASYQKVTGESDGGYLIDHSSFTYLIDKKGQLANSFPHATNPMEIVNSIRRHLM